MPFYDYGCEECGSEFETSHSIHEKPKVQCPKCSSTKTRKLVSACGIVVHSTGAKRRVLDHLSRESDAKQDLLENYGVENVRPTGGASFDSVYNDIKGRGTFVRDEMQKKREVNERKSRAKRREWAKAANKRTPERIRTKREKKAQEEQKKRAVRLST